MYISNILSASEDNGCGLLAYKTAGEETWRQQHKNVESSIEQVLATTPHETPTIRPLASHHENYTN